MRSLTVRQKIISASKESDSGIKYDASSVQSLFLHAVETGLADETIRAKIRPLTQNPKVADEDLIGAMSLAISAEAERSNKFNLASKGKSVKVSAMESAADSNTKKELQKDQQVLATLKAVQAELATMKAEVKNLREAASNQKADPMMPSHAGNGVRTGARPLVKAQKLSGKRTQATPAGQGVASPEKEKSHQCSGCLTFDCHTQLLQCSGCQSVRYCSVRCQKAHWPKHKVLCKAIKKLSERGSFKEKGLGDAQDSGVYASHISPRQQERIAKLVGKKCSVKCYLDEKPTEALWDTGAQVSIVSADFLKSQLPAVQIRDIEQLLGTDGFINLQAANGTDIPYCGWAEISVRLANEKETEVRVPFLITRENIDQPIIGFNVIELMVWNTEEENDDVLLNGMSKSFKLSKSGDTQVLISLIRTSNSDELCQVKSSKKPQILPAGQTVHLPCRANTGPIHRKTPVLFEPDELATWPSGSVHESLTTVKEGNATILSVTVTNNTNHNTTRPGRVVFWGAFSLYDQ
ncbi:unnamed protein product [Porites lobata]|uniref:MYND-type domain-containing protein n=1 Tax=Porites lobata TaxID=104759 RepID=A0ABN8RU15_9CNID|nr:unnamed protein product [Porites lobata]